MTKRVLKQIQVLRDRSELLCYRCGKPIQVGDPVVSHGQQFSNVIFHGRKRRTALTKIYHEDCHDNLPKCTLIRRYCPVCKEETKHDTESWESFSVCTRCEVLIPWKEI